MEYTPEEKAKIKAMFKYLVSKKDKVSGGHCGFGLIELQPILEEMVQEGEIITRPTIHNYKYFINKNLNDGKRH